MRKRRLEVGTVTALLTSLGLFSFLAAPASSAAQSGSPAEEILRAAVRAAVKHANESALEDGRREEVGVVWLDRATFTSQLGSEQSEVLAESFSGKEDPWVGVAEEGEVIECDEPKPGGQGACRVKDDGAFISLKELAVESEGEARVRLEVKVPTPSNTMAWMCPKDILIKLGLGRPPTPQAQRPWEVKSVTLLSAC